MTRSGRYFQPPLLILFVVFMAVSAAAPTFYAGIVSETDVSRNIISDRWMGVSGTVERGNSSLTDFQVGSLKMNSNQTGEVLSAEVEGIKGGGYYLVFLPTNESMDPSNLENISGTDLEKDGIFSENLFPGFYPEYSERFDSPDQTFTDFRNLTVDGETFNASYADLSGSTDMHVLKFDNGTDEYPAFISPIDGRSSGSSFDTCYLSGCNFQALLPRLGTGNFSYSANLISRGASVQGCGSPSGDTSLLVDAGEGTDCIQVSEDDVIFDMYNSVVESDEGCAVSVSAGNSLLRDFKVLNSDTGVCATDANSTVTDANISDVGIAVEAQNSELDLEDMDISSGGTGIALQDSDADLQNVNMSGTRIYGEASSVNIESYQDPLPVPEQAESFEQPVGSRVEINSLVEGNESYVEELGLGYPDPNQSSLIPFAAYKYDLSNESSYSSKKYNVSTTPNQVPRYATIDQKISNFSIFSLYGRNIDGDESTAGEGDEGESESGGSGGSGGGGSDTGGSGGGGALPSGGGSSAGPNPEAVELNLSMQEEEYSLNRGDTVSIQFEVNNTGEVAAPNITTRLESEWSSVPRTFDSIDPDETRNGVVLSTVPEDASVGVRTIDVETVFSDSIVDTENITVNVSEVVDQERVEVVESPSFLRLDGSSTESVGIQVRNPSPRPIRDIEASFRDSECMTAGNQTYTVLSDSTETIQVDIQTANTDQVCNDALVLEKDGEVLGFTPMRVELTRTADSIVSVPVYLVILALWSALLVYRVRKSGRKESFPWR